MVVIKAQASPSAWSLQVLGVVAVVLVTLGVRDAHAVTEEECMARIPAEMNPVTPKTLECSSQDIQGDFPFKITKTKIGGARFHKGLARTFLFLGQEAKICSFGRLNTTALVKRPPKLQHSIHGKVTLLVIPLNAPFCDIETNACEDAEPSCLELGEGQGSEGQVDFCACTTVKVPEIAPDGLDAEVTWKILEDYGNDAKACEDTFEISQLEGTKQKKVLACTEIPAKVRDPKKVGAN